jgi:hypothetical protein
VFSASVQTDLEAHPASSTMGTGSLSRGTEDWASFDYTLTSSIKVKKRVELYLFCPSASWPVLGGTLLPSPVYSAQKETFSKLVLYVGLNV